MKKILSGIFTAAFIAVIAFTSCSSPANGSNSSNNSSNDNQFSFDDFEPAALPQFQGVNPLAGKTFTRNSLNLIFTENSITQYDNNSNGISYDYSIDTTNNLIYVRFNDSYISSYVRPKFEISSPQALPPLKKEFRNEILLNYWIKNYYSKFSSYKYTFEEGNLIFTEAYSNKQNEIKLFSKNDLEKIHIDLSGNVVRIETVEPSYTHNC